MSEAPRFRFYPNAYAEGGRFERSEQACDLCQQKAVWLYSGEIHLEGTPPSVCARCLASGALRRRLAADSFVLQDIVLDGADEELAAEILYATPNVAAINPFEWRVREGEPLAYLGVGDEASLKHTANAQRAIGRAFVDIGEKTGHASHALVFKRLEEDEYVAVIDMD